MIKQPLWLRSRQACADSAAAAVEAPSRRLACQLHARIRERFKRVKSEQKLPGTFQKKAKETKAWHFGWSNKNREVWVVKKAAHLNLPPNANEMHTC